MDNTLNPTELEDADPVVSNDVDSDRPLGLFGLTLEDAMIPSGGLDEAMTLRRCCREYGSAGGKCYGKHTVPELDGALDRGSFIPLSKFVNGVGHVISYVPDRTHPQGKVYTHDDFEVDVDKDLACYCLPPRVVGTIVDMAKIVRSELQADVGAGYLWSLKSTRLCNKERGSVWKCDGLYLQHGISELMDRLALCENPISCCSNHAYTEYQRRNNESNINTMPFEQPLQASHYTGMYGTFHNNQLIDMNWGDEPERPNIHMRRPRSHHKGFICGGHTAHSLEAGKSRRVVHGIRVRLLTQQVLNKLVLAATTAHKFDDYVEEDTEWVVHCMGIFVRCSWIEAATFAKCLYSMSMSNHMSPTFCINMEAAIINISISSGVLMKRVRSLAYMDNVMVTHASLKKCLWAVGADGSYDSTLSNLFSTYYSLVPFITSDRPPRTLMSSIQAVQAVCVPYLDIGSTLSPVHSSLPLVTTAMGGELMKMAANDMSMTAPGMDVMICLADFNDNYEDCIMISKSAADRGLFDCIVTSIHTIDKGEEVPELGEYVNDQDHVWWKVYDPTNTTKHSRKHKDDPVPKPTPKAKGTPIRMPEGKCVREVSAACNGSGRVIASGITQTGDRRVEVLRTSTLVSGDKLATQHGQKGAVKIIPDIDMPWGMDENNEPIKFDMVMAVASVSNRVTVGQYYEMVMGVAACEGRDRRVGTRPAVVIGPLDVPDRDTETVLYDGKTGGIIMRRVLAADGTMQDEPAQAAWGIARVWRMYQVAWDRQHYTHRVLGKSSVKPPAGRTKGGGVRIGEMEAYAMASGGLANIMEETAMRSDIVKVQICRSCKRTSYLCTCSSSSGYDLAIMPYSTLIFDCVTALQYKHSLQFELY